MQQHDEAVEAAVRLDPEGEQAPLVAAQLLGEFVHAPGVESIELARARARQLRQPRRRVRLAQLLVQMLKARVVSGLGYLPRWLSSRTRYTVCARSSPGAMRSSVRGSSTWQKAARAMRVRPREAIIVLACV